MNGAERSVGSDRPGKSDRPVQRLERAEALLAQAARVAARSPSPLEDDEALRREARRLRPYLETLVGRAYGRLPAISYRRRLEAKVAGPWSQYLTLGMGWSRLVRMAPATVLGAAAPTILAHELAHRYAFDESVTTLRGLEVSARLAAEGDADHAVASRLELARLLLGAAMADALRESRRESVDGFFASRAGDLRLARARAHWGRLRERGSAVPQRTAAPDWASTVYAWLPARALENAAAAGARASASLAFPRFPVDSLQAAAAVTYTGVDALTGRRRARVPLDATLELWRGAEGA